MVININEQPKDDHLIFPTKCRADEQEGEGVEQKSEMIGFLFSVYFVRCAPASYRWTYKVIGASINGENTWVTVVISPYL